mgnify:CR=1 FL=1
MTAKILDGKEVAREIREGLKKEVASACASKIINAGSEKDSEKDLKKNSSPSYTHLLQAQVP